MMSNRWRKKKKDELVIIGIVGGVLALLSILLVGGFYVSMSAVPGTPTPDPVTFIRISNIGYGPTNPTSQEPVVVTCSVSYAEDDTDSIATVILYYDNGIIENFTAMNVTTSTYFASIPSQPNGYTVKYWIHASTLGGTSETSNFRFYTVNDPLPLPPPDNETESETVSWELLSFDENDNRILNIQTAEISGTVRFEINILKGASNVAFAKLEFTGLSDDASPGGYWLFTKVSDTNYTLNFDTTYMNNGDYLFEFILLLNQETTQTTGGGGGDYYNVVMSSFRVGSESEGNLSSWIMLIIIFSGVGIAVFVYTDHTRKKQPKRGRYRGKS